MRIKYLVLTFLVLFTLTLTAQVKPDSFERHKVKKKETLYGLARKYNVQIEQNWFEEKNDSSNSSL
jgi:hypothetical protein